MNETKAERIYRDAKWLPGQKQRVKDRVEKIVAEGSSVDQLVESGQDSPPMPWGDLHAYLLAIHGLKVAREQQGLSLSDVEVRTGMNRSQISKLENGQTNPTMQTIARYAAGIGKRIRLVIEDLTPQDTGVNGPKAMGH